MQTHRFPVRVGFLIFWTVHPDRLFSFFLFHRKSQSNADLRRNDSVSVIVHDIAVVGPITATNLSLSKGLAAERARNLLSDPNFEMNLARLCDCGKAPTVVPLEADDSIDSIVDALAAPKLSDETEEGFATLAKQKLEEDYVPNQNDVEDAEQGEEEGDDDFDIDGVPMEE